MRHVKKGLKKLRDRSAALEPKSQWSIFDADFAEKSYNFRTGALLFFFFRKKQTKN